MNIGSVFEVRRDDLAAHRWVDIAEPAALGEGQVLLAVESFALTANNLTYAALGERLKYWEFFPAADTGWGRVPVWAFLRVLDSQADGVDDGARYYGYAPMASHLVVSAGKVNPKGFVDTVPWRQPMAPVYNRYARAPQGASSEREALDMLLRPLFFLSFLLADFLQRERFFGAQRLLISSASSKAAYGAAWLLARAGSIERVGLTSARNRGFVESLRCYDRTVTYEELETLHADEATTYVDFSGGRPLLERVHRHFRALRYSAAVGATQWNRVAEADDPPLPGPPPVFFAAAPLLTRGGQGLQARMGKAWTGFSAAILDGRKPLMRIERQQGRAAVERVYTDLLDGRADPGSGQLLSLS